MPAALPGSAGIKNDPLNTYPSNPSAGRFVVFDPLSGPKGSKFDTDNTGNCSTGAMSTGIGYHGQTINPGYDPATRTITPVGGIKQAGFDDDEIPGASKPNGSAGDSTLMYIGGGRSNITGGLAGGLSTPVPYTAGTVMCGAGEGGSRDGGAGPAFTGFSMKMVTAVGTVTNGSVVETGYVNRAADLASITINQSVFGSASAANAAPS